MNRKITFYIGLTTKNGSRLLPSCVMDDIVVKALATRGIDGFTVVEGWGYWQGQPEKCLVVTVFAYSESLIVVCAKSVAQAIAAQCQQECVLYSVESAVADLAYP